MNTLNSNNIGKILQGLGVQFTKETLMKDIVPGIRRMERGAIGGMALGGLYGGIGGYRSEGTFGGTVWGAVKGSTFGSVVGAGSGFGYHRARMAGMGPGFRGANDWMRNMGRTVTGKRPTFSDIGEMSGLSFSMSQNVGNMRTGMMPGASLYRKKQWPRKERNPYPTLIDGQISRPINC